MAKSSGRQRLCGSPSQQEPLGALQMVEKYSIQMFDGVRMSISEELKCVAAEAVAT